MSRPINKLLCTLPQSFTTAEQKIGRSNIGAAGTSTATHTGDGLMSAEDKLKLDTMVAPVQSDWQVSDVQSLAYIANKPNLAAVATSGSYTDLSNRPVLGIQLTPVTYNVTTFDEIAALVANGGHPILVDSSGNPVGLLKYCTSSLAIFQRYNVQPLFFSEFHVTSSGWSLHSYYTTDTATPNVYTFDRVGTEYKQSTLPKMDFDITSYLAATSMLNWQHNGSDISGTMFDEFASEKPQFVRYDYSTDLAYTIDGAPTGTPTALLTVELVMSRAETQSSAYIDTVCDWAPKIVLPFSDFVQGSGAYVSCEKPLNYSVTFDRQRYESLVESSYYLSFWLRGTISNIAPPGTSHSLRQVAAHAQWTFFDHV